MEQVNALQVIAVALLQSSHLSTAVGLGLRSTLLPSLQRSLKTQNPPCSILEIAPENWCGMGGIKNRYLDEFSAHFTWYCHGYLYR